MLKKFFVIMSILVVANATIAASGIFTADYIKHLEKCEVHIEKYDAEIPSSNDVEGPIHLKTTETILGWKNGKCLTKSVVYSKDLKKDILTSNCSFSQPQLDIIVKKMQQTKSKDTKVSQKAQSEIAKYINENSICVTKNLVQ